MSREYVVQQGDNLSKIARDHGLSSWRDIYFFSENSEFRREHPDPNVLNPGDKLRLPDPGEVVSLPEAATVPQFLRLPMDLAAQAQISPFVPLAAAPATTGSSVGIPAIGSRPNSLFMQILDPSRGDPFAAIPLRPSQPMWQLGGSRPLLSAPCGPWGCARGPFDLDQPRPGQLGDVKDALLSTPQVTRTLGSVGNYLWSNAPPARRLVVGSIAGLTIAGGVTALASSESLRSFALDKLNDVQLPVGEAILLIPGLSNRPWVSTLLRPVKFSLIWQEPGPVSGPPEPGMPSGLQGRGGMLILDLQSLFGGGN